MTITIYHNPDCGTSRNTLAMIRQSGEEPVVIEYLKPARQRSPGVAHRSSRLTVREAIRQKDTPYEVSAWGSGAERRPLLDAMLATPS